jgi:hypothetical protein
MRIVGAPRSIVFRGAHAPVNNHTTSLVIGDADPQVAQTSPFVATPCSEGDTLLPGDEPALGFTRPNDRDLIAELRRAVEVAEALDPGSHGRD